MKRLLLLLLIAHFLKELVWMAIIPIWHFPDEEQHFAQTAFFSEKGYFPKKAKEPDVSEEIDLSSEILGTKRDNRGINKFTYHPEYRIPYTKEQVGLYEKKISALNKTESRQKMVKRESTRYGPIYYFLTAVMYKTFFKSDLFVRVFSSRFISVILSTLTVYFVYLIAKEIFKKEFLSLILAFLVAFQPMFSFVSGGVNSDNLFNLTFTLILLIGVKFINKENYLDKQFIINFLLLLVALVIGFYTKKQIFVSLPILFVSFLFALKALKKKRKIVFLLPILVVVLLLFFTQGKIGIPDYNPEAISRISESFPQYIFWHFRHTIAETIPWYWGVFNWLGVTLPRWTNQVQARILIVASAGMLFYFYKAIKSKRLFKENNLKIVFLLLGAMIYYLAIISWDYFFHKTSGYSFGIQGRYFFPTIVSHMLFLLLGLLALVPKKYKAIFLKLFSGWWLVFSFVGLYTASTAYYQLWPVSVFLTQASQYKPVVFKSFGLSLLFLTFIISLVILFIGLIKHNEKIQTDY